MTNWRAWMWALAVLLAWDASGADLLAADLLAGPGGFAARHAFWAEQLLHDGLRWFSWVVVAWMAFDAWRPVALGQSGAPERRERAWAIVGTLLALLVVSTLKRHSLTSCPWSLTEFGGDVGVRWVGHWVWGEADGGPGQCFPSGHAAASFAFFSLVWVWRHHAQGLRWALSLVLISALLGSIAQWARGAHYVSHSLWTGFVCALVTAAWQWLVDWRIEKGMKADARGGQPVSSELAPNGMR